MRALVYQTAFVTLLWGVGMVFIFDWPRATIAGPMAAFALLYFCGLAVWRFLRKQRKAE
ncbi:hypothetical protein [Albirhodobacter sp. R86504]|jgi:hypothetical protein|uniref:hypothetical protein n=1 Tax=Albirhodobacter sp. R86504 TaxID=3093848 RepID=UPI00366F4C6A